MLAMFMNNQLTVSGLQVIGSALGIWEHSLDTIPKMLGVIESFTDYSPVCNFWVLAQGPRTPLDIKTK